MSTEAVQVDIGVWDWGSPAWRDGYYPQDMPEDWRAAYYANEYRCVGLPAHAWTVVQLSAWREELPESFALWLECGRQQLAQTELVAALAALGPRLAGVWLGPGEEAAQLRGAAMPMVDGPWDPQHGGHDAAVGLYRPGDVLDLRAARAVLEAFAVAPGPQRRQLLVAGSPAVVARLSELGELLGL